MSGAISDAIILMEAIENNYPDYKNVENLTYTELLINFSQNVKKSPSQLRNCIAILQAFGVIGKSFQGTYTFGWENYDSFKKKFKIKGGLK